mgnify:FL=1
MLKNRNHKLIFALLAACVILAGLGGVMLIPRAQMTAGQALTWLRGWLQPSGSLPAPIVTETPQEEVEIRSSTAIDLDEPSPVKLVSATEPLPASVTLPSPVFDPNRDYQTWNNCGPATLALALRFWGWEGDQNIISTVLKPEVQDKNVNIDELAWYVAQYLPGLQAEIRVGGDLATLKRFIANGYPVLIEGAFKMEKPAWPGDDLWAAHYLLVTGYDEDAAQFTVQDSYYGPDRLVSNDQLLNDWKAFNHIYMVIFPPSGLQQVQTLFGADWQVSANQQNTIAEIQNQLAMNRNDVFAWFNLGSVLSALGDYPQAFDAFSMARQLGLPQRMLRYQFTPFDAAYETGELSDLTQLVDYSLKITPDSEESLFWKGRLLYESGNLPAAATLLHKALAMNPGNRDAIQLLSEINP